MSAATTTGTTSRLAGTVFALGALGEMGVGALVVVFPEICRALIGAPLDGTDLFVARMLGVAMLALGVTWWFSRKTAADVARCAAGFLLYNFGAAAVLCFAALAAARPALPWLVCVAHLVLGAAFGAALRARGPATTAS